MQLNRAFEVFIENKSENTKRAYRTVWRDWSEHCKTLGSPTFEQALSYIDLLRSHGASDNTLHQRISILKAIYAFLESVNIAKHDPFFAIRKTISCRKRKLVRPTALISAEKILRALSAPARTRMEIRDRALIALLFGSGLRRSEAAALNIEDCMTTPEGVPYLVIRNPKAGKSQQQPIPQWAWEYFSVLISQRKTDGCKSGDAVFCSYHILGYPRLSSRALYDVFRATFGTGCHAARATYATQLKEQGYSDDEVAEALRHATSNQVRVYDKTRRSRGRSVANKVRF